MDLVQAMRIFSRVAETGNFTKAAEQLDLSVVAVPRSIAGLDKHLNALAKPYHATCCAHRHRPVVP